MKKYKNPYKKHIPVDEIVGAEIRDLKRHWGLHSLNDTLKMTIKLVKGN